MSKKPITPEEARLGKAASIPDEVIDVFNTLLSERLHHGRATITQEEVVERVLAKMPDISREVIFQRHWLDIENLFTGGGLARRGPSRHRS